ncbi:Trehalose operon transcriptional repressor [Grimontia indica]|uniref:Trehalose operon transcriptional repressor n=1 Tax=Grimontia indica TaxID=1056512 RepID=R1GTL4_9GAMM|nr:MULTISPECIES: trehalose operon repressor TreR [Grimontia]EOD79533.1 Trehalose operon transcriptional repressor [Grimontia indica]
MTKKLTILDIAKLAGVGKSTVSRVLNNDSRVKDETRDLVQSVIAQHGFSPSKSAQSMRAGRSRLIGVIVAKLDSSAENAAVSGILSTLYAQGYDAAIMESQFDAALTAEHIEVLKRRNADGIIMFGFSDFDVDQLSPFEERCVVMAVDTDRFSSVSYDNRGAVEQLMTHFYDEGLRYISYLGVSPKDLTTGKARLDSYLCFCHSHGLDPVWNTAEVTLDSGYQNTDALIRRETQAVVCASDTLALAVGKRLQDIGRSDIRLGGIGNHQLLRFVFPQSISVDLGYRQAGEAAAKQLLTQLENPKKANSYHFLQPSRLLLTDND